MRKSPAVSLLIWSSLMSCSSEKSPNDPPCPAGCVSTGGSSSESSIGQTISAAGTSATQSNSTGTPSTQTGSSATQQSSSSALTTNTTTAIDRTGSESSNTTLTPDVSSTADSTDVATTPAETSTGMSGQCQAPASTGHFQMEDLDRGLLAVRDGDGNFVAWRMQGYEYTAESSRVAYNLYRDGQLLETVTDSTNFRDSMGTAESTYSVSLVLDGQECETSESVGVWAQNFIEIPLEVPPAGMSPNGETYAYDTATVRESSGSVNDGSPGDLDGDGVYELVVKWDPSNSQDNSKGGFTGPVYMDAYKLSGERLWRMNLGPNVRAGAHYTQFLVYDLDGDGKSEVAFRTAPGTKDATGTYLSKGPAADDDDSADYRNDDGYVLSGPEYLTVFDGTTGAELDTVTFEAARGSVSAWGDDYGNRVDRFLASVAFVSDQGGSGKGSGRPALLMARGYYTRATVNAYTFREGKLERIWAADSNTNGSSSLAGQGSHSMVVADVDDDGAQEIIYGAAMIQSDGSFGCSTGLNHGDALHASDLIPSRKGLEVFMPHEDTAKPWWHVRQAEDCTIVFQSASSDADNGRGVAADIMADNPGAEFWSSADAQLRSATTNATLGTKPSHTNFLIWWDGDELRETEDGTTINKGDGTRLFQCNDCMSNNYTKATPVLTADLFGDWREEIVWRTPTSSALRVYTTTAVTQRRLFTLMHDPQYRMQVSSEQTAYNQPPHTGFFLGAGMEPPPAPDIHVR